MSRRDSRFLSKTIGVALALVLGALANGATAQAPKTESPNADYQGRACNQGPPMYPWPPALTFRGPQHPRNRR